MLKASDLVGVLVIYRLEVRPFTDKQIELVTTFADQAVIAIENVRLFEEVQARTAELQESLEYQTATSDVLNVISRSPSTSQPVLDAIVETAARLCEATSCAIVLAAGGISRGSAPPRWSSAGRSRGDSARTSSRHGPHVVDRVPVQSRDLHIADVTHFPRRSRAMALALRPSHDPRRAAAARQLALGAILLRRPVVEPFSEKQIELLRTFADQAVIAINNVGSSRRCRRARAS